MTRVIVPAQDSSVETTSPVPVDTTKTRSIHVQDQIQHHHPQQTVQLLVAKALEVWRPAVQTAPVQMPSDTVARSGMMRARSPMVRCTAALGLERTLWRSKSVGLWDAMKPTTNVRPIHARALWSVTSVVAISLLNAGLYRMPCTSAVDLTFDLINLPGTVRRVRSGEEPIPIGCCRSGVPTSADCLCNDQYPICSSYFPTACGYPPDQLLSCAKGAGTRAEFVQQCGYERCKRLPTGNGCDTSCTCPIIGTICGKSFDPACGYVPTMLMQCSAIGAMPTEGRICPGVPDQCDATGGVGRCYRDCECRTYLPTCGSAFLEICGYQKDSLYQCDYGGALPRAPRPCGTVCPDRPGEDGCAFIIGPNTC
ncbi:hypothetical protein BGW41_007273 [Actinomortierella wolfii]|nr:hypothetical protein BGW41_007273 [Actinomortierella wolfii]